jgi:hypothetical protein
MLHKADDFGRLIRCIGRSAAPSERITFRLQEKAVPRGSRIRWTTRRSTEGSIPSRKPYEGDLDESTITRAPVASPRARYRPSSSFRHAGAPAPRLAGSVPRRRSDGIRRTRVRRLRQFTIACGSVPEGPYARARTSVHTGQESNRTPHPQYQFSVSPRLNRLFISPPEKNPGTWPSMLPSRVLPLLPVPAT